jgi:hypothetical protein
MTSIPGAQQKSTIDPVRFCAMTTVALIAWLAGPPAAVILMSGLGIAAYVTAVRRGLRESRCVLRHPALVIGYLVLAFAAAAFALFRQISG